MSQVNNPWEHRRWRGGICRPSLGGNAIQFWVMALVFGGVAAGIALKAPEMLRFSRVHWVMLFPVGFAAAGLGFLAAALVASVRWLRFGRCLVRMQPVPGVIGGHFRGEVLLPEMFPQNTDVRLELVCERTTTEPGIKSNSQDSVSIEREWAHTIRITVTPSFFRGRQCVIPFDFTIPYGLPDETGSRREGDIRIDFMWHMRVFALLDGPDLNLKYRVPVFRTGLSDPTIIAEKERAGDLDTLLRDRGEQRRVRIEDINGVPTYICDARGMKKGLSIVPGFIGIFMLSIGVIIPYNALRMLVPNIFEKAEGWYNLFRLIPLVLVIGACLMMGVLLLLGLLFLFISLRGLVYRRTWIRDGMIHQRSRLFGIPWTSSCPSASATGVNIGDSTSSNGKTWHDIVIERNTVSRLGKMPWLYLFSRITIATNVPTLAEAEEIMARLRQELHLPADT